MANRSVEVDVLLLDFLPCLLDALDELMQVDKAVLCFHSFMQAFLVLALNDHRLNDFQVAQGNVKNYLVFVHAFKQKHIQNPERRLLRQGVGK